MMVKAEDFDELKVVTDQLDKLRQENVALRKMLQELEQEKCVMAHQFLTSSLRLRVSMADPVGYIATRDKEKQQQQNVNFGPP